MEVLETQLRDVLLIKPDINTDFRGDYVMTYNEELYKKLLPPYIMPKFIEHDLSTSTKGVLRGIHYSPDCWKLNQCLYGEIYYVVVNCDEKDPEFGKWQSFILSDRNHHQLFKHPRYGSGFLVLSDYCVFHYMQSEYYTPDNPNQKTFKWDDPRFGIFWPRLIPPILSQRDEEGHYLGKEEEKGKLLILRLNPYHYAIADEARFPDDHEGHSVIILEEKKFGSQIFPQSRVKCECGEEFWVSSQFIAKPNEPEWKHFPPKSTT